MSSLFSTANGSASTTKSAITSLVPPARSKVTLYRPFAVSLTLARRCPVFTTSPPRMRGDGFRQLLIAAADVELLVGLAEERQRAGIGLEPEQENQVERRLLGRIGAVLDDVGDVEERPQRRAMAPGNAPLDVVVDAHLIQRSPGRRVANRRWSGKPAASASAGDAVGDGEEILDRAWLFG